MNGIAVTSVDEQIMIKDVKILFVSPIDPWPPNIGATIRTNSLLSALENVGAVDCVFFGEKEKIMNTPFSSNHRIKAILPRPNFPAALPFLSKFLQVIPESQREWILSYTPAFHFLYRSSSSILRFTSLNPLNYDIVFMVRFETLWRLGWNCSCPTIVDIDDVGFLSAIKALRNELSLILKLIKWWRAYNLKTIQLNTIRRLSAALVCSEEDKNSINEPNVHVVPNIFPEFREKSLNIKEGNSNEILFVGSLVYKPNIEGLKFFIQEILPIIIRKLPKTKLRIVGRTAPNQNLDFLKKPGVNLTGMVDDVVPYIENAAIEVCPILFGEGTRIKILESLSYGKPVVSTTKGAYGISIFEESGLIRVDTPGGIAKACLNLLSNPQLRRKIGELGQLEVQKKYSQAKVDKSIHNLLISKLNGF